ncbi:fibulin-1-like isoform X2 [Syngnathus typhle]|uniref:fibulin-1-like isoform X2 n=1 Tax=Syngnathus typhle TaxID=161592 RepID=UPI002A6ABB89|nr:fibulin-1-like isoform X2 [Syngnathus typhle]
MALWTIFLIIYFFPHGHESTNFALPHVLYGCCQDGKERARMVPDCHNLPFISHFHACRLAQEQCCLAVVEQQLCQNGANLATWQQACEKHFFIGNTLEVHISKRCCDCCMLGMAASSQDPTCGLTYTSLGKDCKRIAQNCCAHNGTEGFNSTAVNFTKPFTMNSTMVPPVNLTIVPLMEPNACAVMNCTQRCLEEATCACYLGYRLRPDGVTCEDVDECLLGVHDCVAGQTCINTEGSFSCRREIGCGAGYELTHDNRCKDIDECTLNIHNCSSNFECNNTEGSFRCHPKCPLGYLEDANGNCFDINECVMHSSVCQASHTCVNTIGSYFCSKRTIACGRGYRPNEDGTRCEDINECQTDVCRGHGCVNLLGSYRCNCKSGFVFNTIKKLCEDVDECKHYPRKLCAHKCENTEGSYRCSCSAGFKLSFDGRNCEDINECQSNPCSQECANVYGSYQCRCHRGYQLSDVNRSTCEDIDECALPTGSQACAYRCSNSPGSFQCSCPPVGYTLASDGRTCQDIDECENGSHSCDDSHSCFNIHGGYRCVAFQCPTYYRPAPHRPNKDSLSIRCHKSCNPNNQECLQDPVEMVTYTVLALPSYRDLQQPKEIVFLRTSLPSHFTIGDVDVIFEMLKTDENFSYDVVKRFYEGYVIGVVRQVKPVAGPRDVELRVALNYFKSGFVSHRNVVVIYIVLSEFWF